MKSSYIVKLMVILLAFFCTANISSADEVRKEFQRQASVEEGMSIQLEHGDGYVTITPWEKDSVDVQVRYWYDFTGIGISKDHDFELEFNEKGNTVIIRGIETGPSGQLFRNVKKHEYTYKIQAPSYMVLNLSGEDGNISIRDWQNNISVRSDDGDVLLTNIRARNLDVYLNDGHMRLTDVKAQLDIRSDDGDLELAQIRGDITINVSDADVTGRNLQGAFVLKGDDGNTSISNSALTDGRITVDDGNITIGQTTGAIVIKGNDSRVRLDEITANRVDIQVGDADVWAYLMPADDITVNIRTEDGDVELRLASDVSADITLETDEGTIDRELTNVSDVREGNDWYTGVFNGGAGNIRIETEDGDIHVQEGL